MCTFVNPTTTVICEMATGGACAGRLLEPLSPSSATFNSLVVDYKDLSATQQHSATMLAGLAVNKTAMSRAPGRGRSFLLNPDGSRNRCLLHGINAAMGKEPSNANALVLAKCLLNIAAAVIRAFPGGKEDHFNKTVTAKITNCAVTLQCIRDVQTALSKVLAGKSEGLDHPATLLLTCLLFANIPLVITCSSPSPQGEDNVHYFATTAARPSGIPPIIGSIFYSGGVFGHYFVYFMEGGCMPPLKTVQHSENVTVRLLSCLNPARAAERVKTATAASVLSNLRVYHTPLDNASKGGSPISLHSSPQGGDSPKAGEGAQLPKAASLAQALDGAGTPSPGGAAASTAQPPAAPEEEQPPAAPAAKPPAPPAPAAEEPLPAAPAAAAEEPLPAAPKAPHPRAGGSGLNPGTHLGATSAAPPATPAVRSKLLPAASRSSSTPGRGSAMSPNPQPAQGLPPAAPFPLRTSSRIAGAKNF